jgi:erythromycin esterase
MRRLTDPLERDGPNGLMARAQRPEQSFRALLKAAGLTFSPWARALRSSAADARGLLPLAIGAALLTGCALHSAPLPSPSPGTATLNGLVRGPDGAVVADAQVTVVVEGGPVGFEVLALTTTDPDGRFVVPDLPPGVVHVSAASEQHASAVRCGQELAADQVTTSPDLTLQEGGVRLNGRISDRGGAPLSEARLVVTPFDPRSGPAPCGVVGARSSAHGDYSVVMAPGMYALFGRAPGYVDRIDVEMLSAPRTFDYVLELAAEPGPAPTEVVDWVRDALIPLSTVDPGSGFDDLVAVGELVGEARVVALGESTHGTREFFLLKHRLLEYLVAEKGFTGFAIEAAMPEGFDVNRYVLTGEGDPRKALVGLYFWTWDTEEVLALIEWMRDWNRDHERKVRFYGIDLQPAGLAFTRTSAWLEAHGHPPDLEALAPLARAHTTFDLRTAAQSAMPAAIETAASLLAEIDAQHDPLVASSSEEEWAEIRQTARVIQQYLELRSGTQGRDASMAENVLWILEREEKVVVWAHNAHVSLDSKESPMGAALRAELGAEIVVFGLEFGSGRFRALPFPFWRQPAVQELSVEALDDESLPAMLGRSGAEIFALDLRALPQDGLVARWFSAWRPAHAISGGFSPGGSGYGPAEQLAARQYDALLYVRETTASRALPPGPPPAREVHPVGPMDFEDSPLGEPPSGWTWALQNEVFDYRASVVECDSGRCLELSRVEGPRYGQVSASLTRRIALEPAWDGGRVRVTAKLRAEGEAWWSVTVEGTETNHFSELDRRSSPMLTSATWSDVTLDVEIPEGAGFLVLTLVFEGEGAVWLDDVEIAEQQD